MTYAGITNVNKGSSLRREPEGAPFNNEISRGVVACPRPDRGVHSAGEFHVVLFLNSGAPLVLEDDILKNYVA